MKFLTRKLALGGIIGIFIILGISSIACAHFNFFLPDEWHMDSATENEIQIIWGHPYEGIYFDAPEIKEVGLISPDGSKSTLTASDIKVTGEEGQASAFKVSFTPSTKGDYILFADMKAIEVEEEEIIWEDHVKAIINYKTTGGWEQSTGQIIEIIPLVRPYGLEEGFVFVGQAFYDGEPLPGATVEIEKYYPVGEAPDPLPDWDPMITRETTTDQNGVFSYTLDEPGIWVTAVSYIIPAQDESHYDKDVRGVLMIPVEETFPEVEQQDDDLKKGMDELDSRISALESDEDDDDSDSMQNMVYAALGLGILGLLIALVALARKK